MHFHWSLRHQSIPFLNQIPHCSQNYLPLVDHSTFLPLLPASLALHWVLVPLSAAQHPISSSIWGESSCVWCWEPVVQLPLQKFKGGYPPWALSIRAQAPPPRTWNLVMKTKNSWENSQGQRWGETNGSHRSVPRVGSQPSSYGHSAWPLLVPPLSPVPIPCSKTLPLA